MGPAPHLGTTVELALNMGATGEQATKGVSMGELALPLICWAVAQTKEIPSSSPTLSLTSMAGGRDGSKVMRVGELAMPFASYNTLESRPYILPGQQGRAGPLCR